jgi:hypothetical protein
MRRRERRDRADTPRVKSAASTQRTLADTANHPVGARVLARFQLGQIEAFPGSARTRLFVLAASRYGAAR